MQKKSQPYRRLSEQEAQLPQRNSASAVHVDLGWLTDRAMCIEHRRIAEAVLFLTFKRSDSRDVLAENGFCREIAAQGHSRSFILHSFAGRQG